MEVDEFEYKMTELENFYGRKLNDSQRDLWFKKLGHMSRSAFNFAIERITSCEKTFPTPHLVIDTARNYVGPYVKQERKVTDCAACGGESLLMAKGIEGGAAIFRCHYCKNWVGRYEAYPQWSEDYERQGYSLDRPKTEMFNANDKIQMRGLVMLSHGFPNMFKKIITKNPHLLSALEESSKQSGQGVMDMNEVLGVKKAPDNEQRRADSLRKSQMESEAVPKYFEY